MSVWWTVCFVTTVCAETLLALTPAPVLKDLSSNPTLRHAKVSAHTHTNTLKYLWCLTPACVLSFLVTIKVIMRWHCCQMRCIQFPVNMWLMEKHTHIVFVTAKWWWWSISIGLSALTSGVCLHMFQISMNVSLAHASMESVATWPGPSTAIAHTAASWTPPTPSAWVRYPSSQMPGAN